METPPIVDATAPSGSDKIWVLLAHLSCFVAMPFVLPLIIYIAMKNHSNYVSENAREALNFHISLFLYGIAAFFLSFILIGVPLLILIGAAWVICSIIAAIKSVDGGCYRYPLTIRLV